MPRSSGGVSIAILDNTGELVVQYVYDAWGCFKVLDANGNEITDETHIGYLNPFRYRGYYYSDDLGLYYLKSRFYDPEVGRFISADTVDYLAPDTVNGLNLYAYCNNNPVMNVDPSGHFPFPTWEDILELVTNIVSGIAASILEKGNSLLDYFHKLPLYVLDDAGGAVLNPVAKSAGNMASAMQHGGKVLGSIGRVLNVVGVALLGLDIFSSTYRNATNPNLSTTRKISDSIVDAAFSVGGFMLSAWAGAKIGALIGTLGLGIFGSILGGVLGAVVAVAISKSISHFQTYFPEIYNFIKDVFHDFLFRPKPQLKPLS